MKTIFDPATREELVRRITMLTPENKAEWGKMNQYQMIKHCTTWNDWVQGNGKYQYRQEFLGKLLGKMVLKGITRNEKPLGKNAPAGIFTIKETDGDTELQKKVWLEQIRAYGNFSNPGFIHDFFGKMTMEEIGIFVYKHMDHHLRQFEA